MSSILERIYDKLIQPDAMSDRQNSPFAIAVRLRQRNMKALFSYTFEFGMLHMTKIFMGKGKLVKREDGRRE